MPISQGLQIRDVRTAPLVKMYEKSPSSSARIREWTKRQCRSDVRAALSAVEQEGDAPLRPSECMHETMLQTVWTTQKMRMTRTIRWMIVRWFGKFWK